MNLDDLQAFQQTDPDNFLRHVEALPIQLEEAWRLGQSLPLPEGYLGVKHMVILGMGGSAIGGSLLEAYAAPSGRAGIAVLRGYDLPAHVAGPDYLVVGCSYSGNTEETLSAFEHSLSRGVRPLALTTGGRLAALAHQAGAPAWTFDYASPPRAAIGFSFGLLLRLACRLGLLPDQAEELADAVSALRGQMQRIGAESPVARNPAKRMAGQLMDRYPVIFGADLLAPAARRWAGQVGEVAKAWAQWEELPEADHNAVVGTLFPENLIGKFMVLFLTAPSNHPRNLRRLALTRDLFMVHGFNTDVIEAVGGSRLAHLLTSLHFGDFTAYYLAMAYGVDPTPVPQIDELKRRLSE